MNFSNSKSMTAVFGFGIACALFCIPLAASAQQADLAVSDELIQCMASKGLLIYARSTCPACKQLVASLGGQEIVKPIYVECSENREKCTNNKKTGYVPEIQIKGELYQGSRAVGDLAAATGCKI